LAQLHRVIIYAITCGRNVINKKFLNTTNKKREKNDKKMSGRERRRKATHKRKDGKETECKKENKILSRVTMTETRFWIGNWIYWILTGRNYK
jgi:hypothetical protein